MIPMKPYDLANTLMNLQSTEERIKFLFDATSKGLINQGTFINAFGLIQLADNEDKPQYAFTDPKSDHIYFYTISKDNDGAIIYDGTFPRSCINSAIDRISELKQRGIESFFTIGFTVKGAFY